MSYGSYEAAAQVRREEAAKRRAAALRRQQAGEPACADAYAAIDRAYREHPKVRAMAGFAQAVQGRSNTKN